MAKGVVVLAVLVVLAVASPASASKRKLHGVYATPSSGSSPVISTPTPISGSSPVSSSPYTTTPSGSSPVVSTPTPSSGSSPVISTPTPISGSSPVSSSPYTTTPSGSSPVVSTPSPLVSTPTPVVSTPAPVISSPSPVVIPPVTSSPTVAYRGYGGHTGCGTSRFWGSNPGRVPRALSLLSTLVRLFGPRVLKALGNRTLLGAIKDTSVEPMDSLGREGSASLVNSYAYSDFPMSSAQVVEQFNAALDSTEAAGQQSAKFQELNEGV